MDSNTSLIITVFLPLAIALVMFGLGLGVTVADFARVVKFPKITFVGLVAKILIMPATAIGLAYAFQLKAPFAIGLVMVAAGPASIMTSVYTKLVKGNVALALTFTAIDNLIGAACLPAYTMIAAALFANRDANVALQIVDSVRIFLLIAVPVFLGMLIRGKFPVASAKMEKLLGVFSMLMIVALIVLLFISEREHVAQTIGSVAAPTLLLLVCALVYGLVLPRILGFSKGDSAAITFSLPLQGTTVVASVALSVFQDFEYLMTPGIYGLFMYPIGFAGVWWLKRASR